MKAGVIKHSSFSSNYRSPLQQNTLGDRSVEYEVVLKYIYRLNGKEYEGSNYLPGTTRNIFNEEYAAKSIIDKYPEGSEADIYYNPNNPSESSLLTGKTFGVKGFLVITITLILAGSIIFGAIYLMNNF